MDNLCNGAVHCQSSAAVHSPRTPGHQMAPRDIELHHRQNCPQHTQILSSPKKGSCCSKAVTSLPVNVACVQACKVNNEGTNS